MAAGEWKEGFQSTPPARGATQEDLSAWYREFISIHAPREGGDRVVGLWEDMFSISIHAPREGGDLAHFGIGAGLFCHFNPRPPRGGRHADPWQKRLWRHHFNPRPPRGGRPPSSYFYWLRESISIHAPREGGDYSRCRVWSW